MITEPLTEAQLKTQEEFSDSLDLLNKMKIGDYTNEDREKQSKIVAKNFNAHAKAVASEGVKPQKQTSTYFLRQFLKSPRALGLI